MLISLAIMSMWTIKNVVRIFFEINMNIMNNYFLSLILNNKGIL